jgi:hypothetical protein
MFDRRTNPPEIETSDYYDSIQHTHSNWFNERTQPIKPGAFRTLTIRNTHPELVGLLDEHEGDGTKSCGYGGDPTIIPHMLTCNLWSVHSITWTVLN